MGVRVLLLTAALSSCIAPYQAGSVSIPGPLPADAFDRVLAIVSLSYPPLHTDRAEFKIESDWAPCEERGEIARRKLRIYLERPNQLYAVVEVQYLYLDMWNQPYWTPPRGHPYWERQILTDIAAAFDSD